MAAPGNNLDFYESSAFVVRVLGNEEVRAAIQGHLRNDPRAGTHVCGPLYTLELAVAGKGLAYIYGRTGQRVNIAYVFEVPGEETAFRARMTEMRTLYCAGKERGRP